MKKYKYLFRARTILFASIAMMFVYSGLNFASSQNVSAYIDIAALTTEQIKQCTDGGGTVVYQGRTQDCQCDVGEVWSVDLGACRTALQLCSDTDGNWISDGSTYRCSCPSGSVLTSGLWCKSNQNLCTNTGGSWIYLGGGSQLGCVCPSGSVLTANRCQASSSATSSTTPIDDRPIQSDCDPDPPGAPLNRDNCEIINIIVIGINFLSAIAGMAIIASIMIAGYQYMTAQDNAGQIQQARKRIIMALTALALFIFMYALLNYLVPGGVL